MNIMPKFYDLETMTQEDLNKLALERNTFAKEIERLKKQIVIMEKYLELIYDLGFDYDGCNTVEGLKNLIDELTRLASLGRVANTTECIYINENKKYNIINEKLKEGK